MMRSARACYTEALDALFQAWRDAVTRFHKRGWTHMTPERVATVRRSTESRASTAKAC
jgi:hypothetical protein